MFGSRHGHGRRPSSFRRRLKGYMRIRSFGKTMPTRSLPHAIMTLDKILTPSLLPFSFRFVAIAAEEQDNGMLPSTGTGDFATVTSIPVQHDSRNFSRRGGTCVHRAASSIKDHDAVSFIHTAQHLLLPLPPQTPVLSSEAFAQEMISRYGSTTNTRRKKRRLASADEEWTSCEALTAKYHKDLGAAEGYLLEDQEAMLEHLQARHGGNVEQAELGLKVHLSHGTGKFVSVFYFPRPHRSAIC